MPLQIPMKNNSKLRNFARICFLFVILMSVSANAAADVVEEDENESATPSLVQFTLPKTIAPAPPKYQFFKSVKVEKPYKFKDDMTYVGTPLFGAALLIKSQKTYFRQNHTNFDESTITDSKNRLLTNFHSEVDNYTQFAPMILATGLKIGGVDGRSDWGRYIVSAGLSYAIMAAIVNPIKYSAKEMRPDGSTRNSFPSGHTATAFVSATILHKEYGLTHSPWYSIGGYACATATGIMRVLNNRHWVSDVLAGAGIGIFSTELAYGLSDLLFKGKGLRRTDLDNTANIIEHPSFFSINMGVGFGNSDLSFTFNDEDLGDEPIEFRFKPSTVVGVEGAYFFNKYIGIGGRLNVRSTPVEGFGDMMDDTNEAYAEFKEPTFWQDVFGDDDVTVTAGTTPLNDYNVTIESDHITEFSAAVGLYFNLPLSKRFALGAKLLTGRSIIDDVDLDVDANINHIGINEQTKEICTYGEPFQYKWDLLNIKGNNTATLGTGISLTYAHKSSFSWRIFADYDYARKRYDLTFDPVGFLSQSIGNDGVSDLLRYNSSTRKSLHRFTIGGSFCVSF